MIAIYLSAFFVGASLISFIHTIIYRRARKISILKPSFCENCNKRIKRIYLIPVFGYIISKGRCNYCNYNIPLKYPILEFIGGLLLIVIVLFYNISINTIILTCIFFVGIYLALEDIENKEIGIIALIVFVIGSIVFNIYNNTPEFIIDGFISLIIMVVFASVFQHKFGIGDAIYMSVSGFLFGLYGFAIVMGLSSSIGILVFYTGYRAGKYTKDTKIAFTPFILIAILILWLYIELKVRIA